jgi:uncharacterized protein (TIGR00251 family)
VRLRVSPNAKCTELRGAYGHVVVKLRVAAPPVGGKANAEVERFVAEKVGAEPSRVRIVRGLSGRDKTVFVDGVGAERVREVLLSRPL